MQSATRARPGPELRVIDRVTMECTQDLEHRLAVSGAFSIRSNNNGRDLTQGCKHFADRSRNVEGPGGFGRGKPGGWTMQHSGCPNRSEHKVMHANSGAWFWKCLSGCVLGKHTLPNPRVCTSPVRASKSQGLHFSHSYKSQGLRFHRRSVGQPLIGRPVDRSVGPYRSVGQSVGSSKRS